MPALGAKKLSGSFFAWLSNPVLQVRNVLKCRVPGSVVLPVLIPVGGRKNSDSRLRSSEDDPANFFTVCILFQDTHGYSVHSRL